MEHGTRKMFVTTLIGVLFLVSLVVLAAYLFFPSKDEGNNGVNVIKIKKDNVGNVSIKGGSNLIIDLTEYQMKRKWYTLTYYATPTGTSTTAPEKANVIATANVVGEGTFDCDYIMKITNSATPINKNMIDAFNDMGNKKTKNQFVLTIDDEIYDLYDGFKSEVTGTIKGLKEGSPKDITASLVVNNLSNIDQSEFAGTNVTLAFNITYFSCKIAK